jgi:branched-chain amino acid transport system ATP-binding protein
MPGQPGERFCGLSPFPSHDAKLDGHVRAERLLDFVGLKDRINDLAGDLSYGQQKLLLLATCMAAEPRLLILDEPVAGVDPNMVVRIEQRLRAIAEQGRGIVFIEHNIDVVRDVADKVIVMDEGRIIAEGVPREVLDRKEIAEVYLG